MFKWLADRVRARVWMYIQILLVVFAFTVTVITSYVFMSRNEYAHLRQATENALDIRFIDTAKITEYAFNLNIIDGSYGILVDSNLNVLVHPNREFLSKPLWDTGFDGDILVDAINGGKDYVTEVKFRNYNGENSVFACRRLENGWYLGIVVSEAAYYSGIRYIATVLIIIGAGMAIVLCAILVSLTGDRDKAYRKIREQNRTIVESINYASKIQKNLLPPENAMEKAFSDHSVIWKPRDIVGGDIYWMEQFGNGTVLCVADCTGHGTPGALLTMLVVSVLDGTIWPSNCDDTAGIVRRLDQKLSSVLHVDGCHGNGIADIDDGCDIAVLFADSDGSVHFSSGNIPVFVCDGKDVTQYKGQRIFVGEGKLKSKDDVATVSIPANPENKFYVASDGLFDQIGGENGRTFGYKVFKQIILDNHDEKLPIITGKVWDAFEEYRGGEARRDDFELIAFKP